jgi:hypothetical protein
MSQLVPIALIAMTTFFYLPQQATPPTPPVRGSSQWPLTAEDFSKGRIDRGSDPEEQTFLVTISAKLAPYRFRLVPVVPKQDYREGRHYRGRIEVSKGSAAILQTIRVHSYASASWLIKSFSAEDINFDGYLDITVLDEHGSKWGSRNYWLFDHRTGRFVINSLAKDLGMLKVSEKHLEQRYKEIHVSNIVGGCADDKRVYRVIRGRLVLLRAEEREAGSGGCTVTIKQRVNGKMKVVSKVEEPRKD